MGDCSLFGQYNSKDIECTYCENIEECKAIRDNKPLEEATLPDDLILRIEGLTQQIEDQRELLRSFFPDASAYRRDSSTVESLTVSLEDRVLTKQAIELMKEFIADGIYKAKATKILTKPKSKKKTVNIQEIISGKNRSNEEIP